MGFAAVKLPLQETVPLSLSEAIIPDRIGAVAVPSASAVRHAPRTLISEWADRACFAVGEATAKAAQEAGFVAVSVAGGDAASLAAHVISNAPAGTVAYLCGKVRRPVFEQALGDAGISFVALETYDTVSLCPAVPEIALAIGSGSIEFALVYSAEAAARLNEILHKDELRSHFRSTTFVCLSARVSQLLEKDSRETVVSPEPNETALLDTLLRINGPLPPA